MEPPIGGCLRNFRKVRTPALRRKAGALLGWMIFFIPVLVWADWPQAAGPDGNWQGHGPAAPVHWSVARDENILWRTALPNGGQSGIAVAGGRIFLTTFDVYKAGDSKMSGTILGHCIDAVTGKILWSVKLHGPTESPMLYAYSDSTSPTPIADGEHVWFFNNSGEMGCWDYAGREIWRRSYTPWGRPYPFNKQHEPILFGDVILNVEPLDGNPPGKNGWNFLRAIDKRTGQTRWIAEDGTTTYCTSVFGHTADGRPAILTGRGGHHDVPERPVGLSLVDLSPGHEGKTIWRFVADTDADGLPLKEPGSVAAPTWQALYTLHWDQEFACWFRLNPEETHLVIDSRNGKLVREQSLIRGVDYRQWDPAAKKYLEHLNVNLRDMRELSPRSPLAADEVMRVLPAWHCNIVLNGYHYFLTTTAHRRNTHPPKGRGGPSHCIARVNIATGKVEYLEVPVTVIRKPGVPDEPVYGVAVRTTTLNSQGQDVAQEDRSRTDGWEIPAFWGSPVAVNDRIFFTTMLGITYVIDSKAAVLDEKALLAINDLGPSGETWSLNSISYDNGRIYHRSLKELVCIATTGGAAAGVRPPPKTWIDPDTGHRVIRLTDEPGTDSFYFNVNAYTPDGREMAYTTDNGSIGLVNLTSLENQIVVQGPVKAVAVGRKTPTLYYTKPTGDPLFTELWCTNVATGVVRKIADLPRRAGIDTINADETLAAGTFVEGDATSDGIYGAMPGTPAGTVSQNKLTPLNKGQMMAQRLAAKLPMTLYTVNLNTGKTGVIMEHSTDWLNHLQFSPVDPTELMYCHEGSGWRVDRLWTIRTDGTENTMIPNEPGRNRIIETELAGHEWWSRDGRTIYIDLHFLKGVVGFLAAYNLDTKKHTWYHYEQNESEIHFNLSPDGKTFCGDGSPRPNNQAIFLLHPELIPDDQTLGTDLISGGVLRPEKLCIMARTAIHGEHNYRLEPNVSFTPDQKYVVFRSNMFGPDYAFAVEVAQAASP